jgi:hypothetical protein
MAALLGRDSNCLSPSSYAALTRVRPCANRSCYRPLKFRPAKETRIHQGQLPTAASAGLESSLALLTILTA